VNPSDKKFSRTTYSPEMTDGRASTEEINRTLTSFELAMSQAATKSDFNKSFCQIFRYPFLILWALWALFIPRRSEPFWLCIAVYGLAWIRFHFQNRNSQNKGDDDIQSVLASVQPEYLKKGLRWHIPEGPFEWIELIKEYRENEESGASAVSEFWDELSRYCS